MRPSVKACLCSESEQEIIYVFMQISLWPKYFGKNRCFVEIHYPKIIAAIQILTFLLTKKGTNPYVCEYEFIVPSLYYSAVLSP